MKTFILLAIGLMASIGFAYVLVVCQRYILKPRYPSKIAAVLPIYGRDENIEQRLRSAYTDILQGCLGIAPLLIIADFGADDETIHICQNFCKGCSYARVCDKAELCGIIGGLQNS
ncbi:MAG: hypothetical protein RSA00_07235 [Hydrogenoanaerobacterium sp.]